MPEHFGIRPRLKRRADLLIPGPSPTKAAERLVKTVGQGRQNAPKGRQDAPEAMSPTDFQYIYKPGFLTRWLVSCAGTLHPLGGTVS